MRYDAQLPRKAYGRLSRACGGGRPAYVLTPPLVRWLHHHTTHHQLHGLGLGLTRPAPSPNPSPTPCTLHPAPCTLHPALCTLHPGSAMHSRMARAARAENFDMAMLDWWFIAPPRVVRLIY